MGPRSTFRPRFTFSWTFAPRGRLSYEAYIHIFIYIYITFTFIFINLYLHLHYILNLHLHLHYIYIYITFTFILLFVHVFFTKRNLAQYPHRSALQAPYFVCAEIWWIAMFLAYQRASRPYKMLVFDDFTFFIFTFLYFFLFGVFCWGH